jgi:chaperonin GroEL
MLIKMKSDNLYFDAQPRLKAGIDKTARAVGVTMGTGGSNAIIEAIESPGHLMTNDGFSIANSIVLADPIEDMGRKMLLEAINRANRASGDGSSTTCVLTAAMIEEGMKHMGGNHPMDIKRSMEECLPLIEKSIDEQTQVIEANQVGQVATISAEDPEIGARIQEIYEQIGKDGVIYWDISKTGEDSYTIGSGITVDGAGFVSPYLCDANENGQSTNQVRIKNPYILITKQKITSANDLGEIGLYLNNKEVKDLIVFVDEIDPLIIADIVKTRMVRGFRFVIVKMPVLWKDWWYEDLAKATGATVVDPTSGFTLKMLKEEHLGRASNIVVTKDDTFIDGIKDVKEHVAELVALGTDEGQIRATRLNTKTARYFVGAQSDSALSYRRLKVEDAISASYQALNGGIVAGGGVALRNVAFKLPDTIGGKVLKEALMAPITRIMSNAGIDEVVADVMLCKSNEIGINTKTREAVNMLEDGISDPRNVVFNAVKNAISVSAAVITAPTIVTLPREEQDVSALQQNVVQR